MPQPSGACAIHSERVGQPCSRCGTFACADCTRDGLCRSCLALTRTVAPGDTVGVSRRVTARAIDLGVVVACAKFAGRGYQSLMQLPAFAPRAFGTSSRLSEAVIVGVLLLALVFVAETTARLIGGASLGDLLSGIRLVKVDGRRPGLRALLVRERYRIFESVTRALDGIRYTPLRQRPADVEAGTTVVRVDAAHQTPAWATAAGVAGQAGVALVVLVLAFLLRTALG